MKMNWEYHPGLIPVIAIIFTTQFNELLKVAFLNHATPIYLFIDLFVLE